jgi:hypothetical protein
MEQIDIDGEIYNMQDLPASIIELIELHDKWKEDHAKCVLEAKKCDAACHAVKQELRDRMKDYKNALNQL